MVQLKQLFDSTDLDFVAGRKFLFNGTTYQPGDDVPKAQVKAARNRESLLRSGRVIMVTDDLNELPRAYRREVKLRAITFRKLGRTDNVPYTPIGKTIPQIQADLNNRLSPGVWAKARLQEAAGTNRAGVLSFIDAGHAPEVTVNLMNAYKADPVNYVTGAPLNAYPAALTVPFTVHQLTIPQAQQVLTLKNVVRQWAYALLDEQKTTNRGSLVTYIKAGTSGVSAGALQTYVEDTNNYGDNTKPLYPFVAADGVAAY